MAKFRIRLTDAEMKRVIEILQENGEPNLAWKFNREFLTLKGEWVEKRVPIATWKPPKKET